MGRIRNSKLRLQRHKCTFAERSIKFLGYRISEGKVQPDADKLRAITQMPKPSSIEQLQSFIGKCSYYRNFIKDFSKHVAPLYSMTKSREIVWTEDAEKEFEYFQHRLTTPPILAIFDPSLKTILMCDASGFGLGACVTQIRAKKEHPVAFYSRMMNSAERKYSTTEQECLAVVFAIKQAHHYVYGTQFTVCTDHAALKWILNLKDTKNRRLASWNSLLNGYDFDVVHRADKKHANADALSRNPLDETIPIAQDTDLEPNIVFTIAIAASVPQTEKIIEHQSKDDYCIKLKTMTDRERDQQNIFLIDNILKKKIFSEYAIKYLIVLPMSMFEEIFEECHNHNTAAHQAISRTMYRINQTFYRPKLLNLVANRIQRCHSCQVNKPRNRELNAIPGLMPHSHIPFECISVDLCGPWPRSVQGNLYSISVIDCATRFLICGAIENKRMETIAKFLLEKVYFVYSFPRVIISDRGKEFVNNLFDRIHKTLGIQHNKTTAFNPRANSIVERSNRNLSAALRHYLTNQNELWETFLPPIVYALNTSIHETLRTTPFFLLFSRDPTSISEYQYQTASELRVIKRMELINKIRNEVEQKVIESQKRTQERDETKYRREQFSVGDLVLLDLPFLMKGQCTKLQARYRGPYVVVSLVEDQEGTYVVRKLSDTTTKPRYERVNLRHMKRYINQQREPRTKQSHVEITTVTTETSAVAAADRTDHPADQSNDLFHSFDPSSDALVVPLSDEANKTSNNAENNSSNKSDTNPEEIAAYIDDIANIANSNTEPPASLETANNIEHPPPSRPNYFRSSSLSPPPSHSHQQNASSTNRSMIRERNRSRLTSTPIIMVTDENGRRQIDYHSLEDVSIEIPIEPMQPSTSTHSLRPRRNLRPPDRFQS